MSKRKGRGGKASRAQRAILSELLNTQSNEPPKPMFGEFQGPEILQFAEKLRDATVVMAGEEAAIGHLVAENMLANWGHGPEPHELLIEMLAYTWAKGFKHGVSERTTKAMKT